MPRRCQAMGGGMKSPWTESRTELLRKLWSGKLSASQIAAELGGISRNSVIGKVHRLNLSGRAKPPPQERRTAREKWAAWDAKRQPSAANGAGEPRRYSRFNPQFGSKKRTTRAPAKLEGQSMELKPMLKPVHILDRNMFTQCAWPLWGDRPAYSELMCCGDQVAPGEQSHCEYHAAIRRNGYPQRASTSSAAA